MGYLQGLLEVEQSLASCCFIFDSQNPHTWEHWEWNILLPNQIVFWIILACLFKLPLTLPQDKTEAWISLGGKWSYVLPLSCDPTVGVKILVIQVGDFVSDQARNTSASIHWYKRETHIPTRGGGYSSWWLSYSKQHGLPASNLEVNYAAASQRLIYPEEQDQLKGKLLASPPSSSVFVSE